MKKCYKIFILSDAKTTTNELSNLLTEYENYELHFIPSDVPLFDVYKSEPDVVVFGNNVRKIVKCHEWSSAVA